jgi:uncharacterized protein
LTIVELSGNGKVLSNTKVYVKSQEFPVDTPFNLALVELDEGPRLLGVLESENVGTGTRVTVLFRADRQEGKSSKLPRIFFQLSN